jgi:hypothetical protein
MKSDYFANPLNRKNSINKYYLRKLENFIKNLAIYIVVFPLILPFLLLNLISKNKFFFKDFFNQNAIVFISYIFKHKDRSVLLIKISDFHKALSRFGFSYLMKNFSINLWFKDLKTISFLDKNADYYFNPDYFYFFDKKMIEKKNNFVLPFYNTKNFYLKGKLNQFIKLQNSKKKFKIIFSGTTSEEWYENLQFNNLENKKFLNRNEVLNIVKENFSERIVVLNNSSQIHKINNTNKDILILETNPKISKRQKSFSEVDHMKFISESEFFLCMPGSSMPLCYHLIEACLVGTIPILSYNDFLFPKLTDNEALFYFNKTQLLKSINDALYMDKDRYDKMKKKIIDYYNFNLSPVNIYNKLQKKNIPLEIFTNFDHTSSRLRLKRLNR